MPQTQIREQLRMGHRRGSCYKRMLVEIMPSGLSISVEGALVVCMTVWRVQRLLRGLIDELRRVATEENFFV